MWKITQQGIEKRRYIQALTAVDVERLVASSSQDPTHFVTEFKDLLRESVKARNMRRPPDNKAWAQPPKPA